jgi:hypothetical protein
VTARHPLDMAVSSYHHGANIDRTWQRQRDGQPAPAGPEAARPPLRDWLLDWISRDADPRQELDSGEYRSHTHIPHPHTPSRTHPIRGGQWGLYEAYSGRAVEVQADDC